MRPSPSKSASLRSKTTYPSGTKASTVFAETGISGGVVTADAAGCTPASADRGSLASALRLKRAAKSGSRTRAFVMGAGLCRRWAESLWEAAFKASARRPRGLGRVRAVRSWLPGWLQVLRETGLSSVDCPRLCLLSRPPSRASGSNADDRLALDPIRRVEGGDGVIEGRDGADVRPHSPVTCPPDDLTQLGAIGYDDEVNRESVSGPCLGRAGDGHQGSPGSNQARGPLRDVAAEDIENQVDCADIF